MASSSSFLSFFRVFLPSWKFFNEAGPQPALWMQVGDHDWQPVLPENQRSLSQLFLNSEGNLRHALDTMIERLLQESANIPSDQLAETVSYRLVENCVRLRILCSESSQGADLFRFKIIATHPECQDLLISMEHELSDD
jgi:hypothetical protein